MEINYLELQKLRLINNGLVNKFNNTGECVEHLCGIQSQYQNYALISIYSRTLNFQQERVFEDDNLIKCWAQRTTLHILHKSDYDLMSKLYRNKNNWVYKYLKQLDVSHEDILEMINDFLRGNEGISDKKAIEGILPEVYSKKVMQWSGALILATYHKIAYGVLNREDKKLYVVNNIVSESKTVRSLMNRYFTYYGPASKNDFFHWSGLKKQEVIDELEWFLLDKPFYIIESKKYYFCNSRSLDADINYPIILGKFDPLLVSYSEKKWILKKQKSNLIWRKAGQIEGVILTENGLESTWHYKKEKNIIIFYIRECNGNLSKIIKKRLNEKFKELSKRVFQMKNIKIKYE